jgi:osmotically-inducible protein OsmY
MFKLDSELQRDVIDELRWDPAVGTAEVGVSVKDGVVTLTGTVDTAARRFAAVHATERVAGVKAIAEDVRVKLPNTLMRSDTEIAHAAVNALKWNVEVPDDLVKVRVDDGWLILEGQVEWTYQKYAAETSVRYLAGVRGVTNNITLKPRAFAPDVRRRIQDALKRSAEVDSQRVSVEAVNGKVTLRGTVRSFAERLDAERAAWSAPGVMTVEDQLAISVPVAPVKK